MFYCKGCKKHVGPDNVFTATSSNGFVEECRMFLKLFYFLSHFCT